ncbi:MAG: J domain-containing protein [Candidatus Kapaibacterium sp.]
MENELISSPVREELLAKIRTLKADIQAILKEWFELQNTLRPRLLAVYDEHFQALEIEIQQRTMEAADIGRRVELLSIKKARGEKLTPEVVQLVHTFVDKEFESYRKRLSKAFDDAVPQSSSGGDPQSKGELPKLYREIVKKLHPDVNSESKEFTQFWQETQNAFEKKNLQKMRALHSVICGEETTAVRKHHPTDLSEENALRAEIKELEIRFERESRTLKRLRSEEPFRIEKELYDPEWIALQEEKLRREILKKDHEIEHLRATLHHLTGGGKYQPPKPTPEEKEEQNFQDDFVENTYFGNR